MEYEQIDEVICKILVNDGPDRHVDGHEVITNFIIALLADRGGQWVKEYEKTINQRIKNSFEHNLPDYFK